jgi:DASH complex subunit ASK1
MFGKGAVGSTPLGKKQFTGNESWESSIESPFDRNDRKLRELQIGDGYDDESDMPTPSLPSGYGIPRPDESSSSMSTSPSIRPPGDRSLSSRPLSSTPKAARPTHYTDLRNTPLNAKFPKPISKSGLRSHYAPADDSDDDLLGGMSPPRTMNFGALPPRVAAINAAVQNKTPGKRVVADAILDTVMAEITGGEYADSPKIDTPDFIRRYSIHPGASTSAMDNSNPSPLAPSRDTRRETRRSMANTSFGSDIVTSRPMGQEGDDSDDSFSSDDSGTVPPPQGDYRSDISYTTNTPGATARYGNVGDFSTMHPGASRGTGDDNEVFGVPAQGKSGEKPAFGLKKQEEMYTYMGGRLEDAAGTDATPAKINGRAEVLGGKR